MGSPFSTATSANQLIQAALEELGIYAPGEVMTDADAARGLDVLNKMLDEWASQLLFVYQLNTISFTNVTAIGQYTIGVNGATISAVRPAKVQMGPGAGIYTNLATSATSPINVVSAIEYKMIESGSTITGITDTVFYDNQYGLGVINLAPLPSSTTQGNIQIQGWYIFLNFANLYTVYNLAYGVEKALQDNLAVNLKSYFSEAQLNPAVVVSAAEAKDFIRYQSINSRALIKRTMLSTGRQHAPKPDVG